VVDLIAQTPLVDLLPISSNGCVLAECTPGYITSLGPFRGKEAELKTTLLAAHGLGLPADGRVSHKGGLRVLWAGRGQYFLCGDKAASKTLAKSAALTDQSDGWAVMTLTGKDAGDVLARLCPLDIRPSVFGRNRTARTEVAHMMAVLSVIPKGFEIMVMRSFAADAVHHIHAAMISVAGQNEL